jgi:hypothetical protein
MGAEMKKYSALVVFCFCVGLLSIGASLARADEKVEFNEAFGAAAGMALYDTQTVIEITADSIGKSVYSSEKTTKIIREQGAMLDVLNSYSKKLIQYPSTTDADKASLKSILSSIDKLYETLNALKAYIQSPSKSNADNFQTKRKTSYSEILKMLGIENQK